MHLAPPTTPTRVVVITSPAQGHPSTEIIWTTLRSIAFLSRAFAEAPITVVCDGCRSASSLDEAHAARLAARLAEHPCRFSKRGIVSDDVANAYELFKRRLASEAAEAGYGSRLELLELTAHHGFALAVRQGLRTVLAAGARYALVVQHDRAFCRRMPQRDVTQLMQHFEAHPTCRYIGFPSGTSKLLARRTANEYKLHTLLEERTYPLRPSLGPRSGRLSLRPCIFWYDSNHLVDAARALEIYEPYRNAPAGLTERVGGAGVGRFRLRRGDFTEERFGVEQRNLLVSLRDEPAECVRYFDWFGSYLIEEVVEIEEEIEIEEVIEEVVKEPRVVEAIGVGERTLFERERDGHEDGKPLDASTLYADKGGRVTYVDHIDARGMVPPSARRAGSRRAIARVPSAAPRRAPPPAMCMAPEPTPEQAARLATSAMRPPDHENDTFLKQHTSTVALVPPEAVWPSIQTVRRALRDKGLYRWPPHINLLYPFIAPQDFADAVAVLSPRLAAIAPLTITLDTLECFGGRHRGVLYATCSSADEIGRLRELQAALQAALPSCDDQQRGGVFTPHMTLSHFASRSEAEAAKAALEWSPVSFACDESVHLMRRVGGSGQFERAATLRIGSERPPTLFDPPRRFESMPSEEEGWVRLARKEAFRRGGGGRGRAKGGRSRRPRRSPEERAAILARTPEEIAEIRRERAAKRARLEAGEP